MTRGKEYYKQQIVDRSPVEIYTATNTAMLEYPYILGHPKESSPSLADQSDTYILDSGIGDDSVDTDYLVERAADLGADYVVPTDVMGDTDATTAAIVKMQPHLSGSDIEMIVPLQSDGQRDRYEHYRAIASALDADLSRYRIAIGGIRDISVADQILTACYLRERLGDDVWLHAFGCGINREWIVAIRKRPGLIDSLDTSKVYQEVTNGRTIDAQMRITDHPMTRGSNSTCLTAMHRERLLYMFNHMIGPDARESDVPTEFESERLQEAFSAKT